jgi:mRNA degradation ribonuclease J1/J2
VLSLIRPRYFVPVHGEYRQLSQHARVAQRVMGGTDRRLNVLLAQDGDIIQFDELGARIADKAPTGARAHRRHAHGAKSGDEVLRDRRHIAGDGVVVAVVAISRQTGALVGEPELVARGFVVAERDSESLVQVDAGRRDRRLHRGVQHRGAHGPGPDDRKASGRAAEILQETFGPAAARVARAHGDLTCPSPPCLVASVSLSAWRCLRSR